MPLSAVQKGTVSEYLFLVYAVLGSDGGLEVARQATDDDQRDADVHRRGDFNLSLGLQIKSAMSLEHHRALNRLEIRFKVLSDRLLTHPFFYYFFACLDPRNMRFADPVFIIPSAEVHAHATPHLDGDTWQFHFHASLEPNAHDRWVPYRVNTTEIGNRILAIIADLEKGQTAAADRLNVRNLPGALWVRRQSGIVVPQDNAA